MDKEALCKEGCQLWDAVDYRETNSYDDYRKHLLLCKECQDGLNLGKKDLLRIKEDVDSGGYKRRREIKNDDKM